MAAPHLPALLLTMPQITALTPEHHGHKRWQRYTSYTFARERAVTPLVGAELARAALALPIVFLQQDETWFPAALLGLAPDTNLLVAPDGRWRGNYVPASLRGHPFQLARSQDDQWVLCIDESSELITDGPEGEAFFGPDDKPSAAVSEILDFLGNVARSRELTEKACAALARHGCLQPCPITVKTDSGEKQLSGLHQLDEDALNQLDDVAFLELRQLGALPIAYFQAQSLQHLPSLTKLAETRTPPPPPAHNGDIDLSFLSRDGTLKFDNL